MFSSVYRISTYPNFCLGILAKIEHVLLNCLGFTSTYVESIDSKLFQVYVQFRDTTLYINLGPLYLDWGTTIERKDFFHMSRLFVVQDIDLMSLLLIIKDEDQTF